MSDPITDMRDKLDEVLDRGMSDVGMTKLKKQVQDICQYIEDELEYEIKNNLASTLSGWVQDMARRSVEAILAGDEELFRRYMQCQEGHHNGRTFTDVIHGKLFEARAVELRRRIVEAHADLLRTERIKDLEAQLSSVLKQYNQLKNDFETFRNSRL
jgi:hypothetical protein